MKTKRTHNIAYSGQSGHYKQDTFVRLEQTFVFQTSRIPCPARRICVFVKGKKRRHSGNGKRSPPHESLNSNKQENIRTTCINKRVRRVSENR